MLDPTVALRWLWRTTSILRSFCACNRSLRRCFAPAAQVAHGSNRQLLEFISYEPDWAACWEGSPTTSRPRAVWDLVNGGEPKSFGSGYDFEFGGDGKSIVVLGIGTGLTALDIATGQKIRAIDTPTGVEYNELEIDPTGRLASVLSFLARRVDVIDMDTGDVRKTLEYRDPNFAQFSADGATLAVAGNDSLIRLYDTDNFVEREHLAGTSGGPFQIFFSSDGSHLFSARTGEVRYWDISPTGPEVLGNFQVSGSLINRLVVAAMNRPHATVYTNSQPVRHQDTALNSRRRARGRPVLLLDPSPCGSRPLGGGNA